jgi:tetratricopeptide (TPR) repeat protein
MIASASRARKRVFEADARTSGPPRGTPPSVRSGGERSESVASVESRDATASRFEAATLYEEARIRRSEGNTTGAFARYRRVLEMAAAAGDPGWKAEVMAELGEMYQAVFAPPDARRWYSAAIGAYAELERRSEQAALLQRLGQVEELAGELDRAEELFDASLALALELQDRGLEARVRLDRGSLLWARKREAEGAPELLVGYRLLKQLDPQAALQAAGRIREWRGRVGAVRYRSVLRAAGADAELLEG